MSEIYGIFNKYKVKSKSFTVILILTIIEIIMVLWLNNWQFTPLIFPPFIQFVLIFENRDVWKKLSPKERENLSTGDLLLLEILDRIKGITEKKDDTLNDEEQTTSVNS